ncbi:hypothetical protein QPK29_032660 [Massilia sp. YIM B02787]|uniref:Uncharacterized protein n=1 Tax=Massilia orientalis TaxID=3050128 RepID=A0ACC7MK68_9BURK
MTITITCEIALTNSTSGISSVTLSWLALRLAARWCMSGLTRKPSFSADATAPVRITPRKAASSVIVSFMVLMVWD